jgi:hypothetical protein
MCRHGGNLALAERILSTMSRDASAAVLPTSIPTPTRNPSRTPGGTPTPRAHSKPQPSVSSTPPRSPHPHPSMTRPDTGADTRLGNSWSSAAQMGSLLQPTSHYPPISLAMQRRIQLAVLRQRWSLGQCNEALAGLESLLASIDKPSITTSPGSILLQASPIRHIDSGNSIGDGSAGGGASHGTNINIAPILHSNHKDEEAKIHLECLLKLGAWKLAVLSPGEEVGVERRREVLDLYQRAININNKSYRYEL